MRRSSDPTSQYGAHQIIGRSPWRSAVAVIAGVGLAMAHPVQMPVAVGHATLAPGLVDTAAAAAIVLPIVIAYVAQRRRVVVRVHRDAVRELAQHDPLTGLANRQVLNTWSGLDKRAPDALGHPCVLFVDLDRFKYVNDTHGHRFGDQLLAEVATRLRANVRRGRHGRAHGRRRVPRALPRRVVSEHGRAGRRFAWSMPSKPPSPSEPSASASPPASASRSPIEPGIDLDHLIHHADRAMDREGRAAGHRRDRLRR